MDRLSAWSVGLFLAFVGSSVAHTLTYAAVIPDDARRAHVLQESGHAYLSYLPCAVGLMAALALLGLVARVVATEGRRPPPGWPIAFLPALTFVVQEHFERLGHHGTFPWDAVLAPTFLPGLALQLPLGVLAYVAARALLRGAEELGASLRRPAPHAPDRLTAMLPLAHVDLVCPQAVPTGRVTRGPPPLVAA